MTIPGARSASDAGLDKRAQIATHHQGMNQFMNCIGRPML